MDIEKLIERLQKASAYIAGHYKMTFDDDQIDLLSEDTRKAADALTTMQARDHAWSLQVAEMQDREATLIRVGNMLAENLWYGDEASRLTADTVIAEWRKAIEALGTSGLVERT